MLISLKRISSKNNSTLKKLIVTQCAYYSKKKDTNKQPKQQTRKQDRESKKPFGDDEELLSEALLDYMKHVPKPRIPKTENQFKKDKHLADLYSVLKNRERMKLDAEWEVKRKLSIEATEALPLPLKEEAKKIDYIPFPFQFLIYPKTTPPIPGFDFGVKEDQSRS